MWKDSKRVGFGKAFNQTQLFLAVVALYDPPGNSGDLEGNVQGGESTTPEEEGSTPSVSSEGTPTPSLFSKRTPTPSMSQGKTPIPNMSLLEFINDFLDRLLEIFAAHTSSSMSPEGTSTPSMSPRVTPIPRRFLLEFINVFFDHLLQIIGSNSFLLLVVMVDAAFLLLRILTLS